ncbi:class I SAM-dependent methyltransferase [Amphiplicatus metriothermophilus]|uniref:Methyltransferase domain-containing protein n=1 Tax=Amphiplicatus metriothermophilus TaxID=1519374 RepID=A0A239PKP7_9PROT|nr:class I SAM-dependent methyltransferase [Amphiplicatus metriothermophilus]MBB5517535.1 ubiquinone/menaquinone biosynthesis C-methylase UbiE [Amphiplicatus metriothermophilus]SNT68130.1 Methyltransferase domain-containing protein [Amphiplicatus metriothermophilus]
MGFYRDHIEPALVDFACGLKPVRRERAAIAPLARGRVLEVGFGSGRNAPYYDRSAITRLFALEPSEAMRRKAARRIADLPFPVEWLDLPGEEIPLDDASVDTVLVTYTLCTIPDVARALAGMRRVLKPGGRLAFLEHGRAPDPGVARWQDRLNGVWGRLAGGCNLNRDPVALIERAGFRIERADRHYARGAPRFAGYMSAGLAVPR